jgi:hypothetical protein
MAADNRLSSRPIWFSAGTNWRPARLTVGNVVGLQPENVMSETKPVRKGQPEVLATFAAAATHGGKKPDDVGLTATRATAAIPTDPDDKVHAATKVLREGVLGTDQGAEAAIDKLPDRISGKQ